jgi:hypothetical protein
MHDGIQHLDSETLHINFGGSSDVNPQVVERRHGRVRNATALEVSTLDNGYTGNWSSPRQDLDLLPFVKLDPKRMLPDGADFTQAQVAIICYFRDGKGGTIEGTCNYPSRTAAAFA